MRRLVSAVAWLLASSGAAGAHPHSDVDQQALLALSPDAMTVTIRIVPSVAEGAAIFVRIDADGDGVVSEHEAARFGARVMATSRLEVDGRVVRFAEARATVPDLDEMSAGVGMIEIAATASFTLASASDHRVTFEISYDELSHDWQLQPFFSTDFVERTSSRTVDRGGAPDRVSILFSSPAEPGGSTERGAVRDRTKASRRSRGGR